MVAQTRLCHYSLVSLIHLLQVNIRSRSQMTQYVSSESLKTSVHFRTVHTVPDTYIQHSCKIRYEKTVYRTYILRTRTSGTSVRNSTVRKASYVHYPLYGSKNVWHGTVRSANVRYVKPSLHFILFYNLLYSPSLILVATSPLSSCNTF